MKSKILGLLIVLSALLLQLGCTEPFEIESQGYESILVVESTITNEMKRQIVKLSRTSPLESNSILFEDNADVNVVTNNGGFFHFSQDFETGLYISDRPFRAQPNVLYRLEISTNDGGLYRSSNVEMPPVVPIGELFADRVIENSENKDGVEVLVNTEDPLGNAKYFRYEFEETYKVVVPHPSPYSVEITDYVPFPESYTVVLTPRTPEEVCYTTEYSTGIIQTSTTTLNQNKVFRYPIKYISKNDPKFRERYSILVRQYVQSVEAFTFNKILKDLGDSESLLSQGQPGYPVGNITSNLNADEKVIGFFEVSSVSSRRIFFNYEDFGFTKPPYFQECEVYTLDYRKNNDPNEREVLRTSILYYGYQVISGSSNGIYKIVEPECSVCSYFSSNVKPDFWED